MMRIALFLAFIALVSSHGLEDGYDHDDDDDSYHGDSSTPCVCETPCEYSYYDYYGSYYFCDLNTWTCSGQNEDQVGLGWVDCVDDAPVQTPIPTAARYSSAMAAEGANKHAASAYFIGGGLIAFAVIAVASVFVVAFRGRTSTEDALLSEPLVAEEQEM